jgi:YVTN family beta-propeller protein
MRGLVNFILFVMLGAIWLLFSNSSRTSAESTPTNLASSSSHLLALSYDGKILLAVNPESDSVTLINSETYSVLSEIPVGDDPRSVAVNDNFGFVANYGSDTISMIDLHSRTRIGDLSVGDRPLGVAVSPDGRFLAVAEMGQDSIRFISTNTLITLVSYPVGDRPSALSFTPDGDSLLVSHLLNGEITRLAVAPYTSYLPSVTRNSSSQELNSSQKFDPLENQNSFPGEAISIPTWPNVAPAPAVIVNKTGTRAYLPQTMANGLGLNDQFDSTVFPKVSVINLVTSSHQTSEHIALPETDRPVGLPWDAALTKNDNELWVVNAASNDISVIDISNPMFPIRAANIKVGDNPRGIVFSQDNKSVFVYNALAGTLSVIDANSYIVTSEISTTNIPLPPLLLTGKKLFHSSGRADLAQAAWISCNTCHIEGEHDGRTWLIQFLGEVPPGQQPLLRRNTTSLLGMIETYPLRWSAEWDESADSEFSIRFEQFGTGLIAGDMHPTLGAPNQGRSNDLDSLAAFIDSLALPSRNHELTPAERRGQDLFASPVTECQTCHPPPLYTDLQTHDVGTGSGSGEWLGPVFDTPALRYLYDSAPYLHDGSSATLYDVLTTDNLHDEHGVTSHLSEQELDDLIAFLMILPYK